LSWKFGLKSWKIPGNPLAKMCKNPDKLLPVPRGDFRTLDYSQLNPADVEVAMSFSAKLRSACNKTNVFI